MTQAGHGLTHVLVLGVFLHALYVLSIFDIYFTSPVVQHIESLVYTDSPPAKRVVIFVADGCRADKFFETNGTTTTDERVSFLRHVIQTQGSWGVSHTRVPTESRPGHVALFAGMYEDVSAVTKGWADNPVNFDSIFNQSTASFLFGSPDIVPMFARQVPHAHEEHYSHEEEDFAKRDASELDVWVFRRLQNLLRTAHDDAKLHAQLNSDKVVIFCHYLGIDSNGHAHRPNSKDYLNNIALVDEVVEKSYRLIEDYYNYDQRTAYVFTADHGMSLKGAHGDGDPANTRTPLVVWGAGVQKPVPVPPATSFHINLPTQSRAQVRAQLQAQEEQEARARNEWGVLAHLMRNDVMQADVAPLISALLGLPYPRNSVGVLPFSYLTKGAYRAHAVRSNARQLYLHALRKEHEKEGHTVMWFQPYRPFRARGVELLRFLAHDLDDHDDDACDKVERVSQEVIDICLQTLEYFQRYDWFFLLSLVVLGYLGWIFTLLIAYVHPLEFKILWLLGPDGKQVDVKLVVGLFATFGYLALEHSPFTYYLYVFFPLVFSLFLWNHAKKMRSFWKSARAYTLSSHWTHSIELLLLPVSLELVVWGYEHRAVFGLLFSLVALSPSIQRAQKKDKRRESFPAATRAWTISCGLLSIFPYLPTEYGEHTALVHVGGLALLLLTTILHQKGLHDPNYWPIASFGLRATPVLLSLVTLHMTMHYLEGERSKPPFGLTIANWVVAILPIVALGLQLPQASCRFPVTSRLAQPPHLHLVGTRSMQRLVDIMLAFAPSYILLSIAYETLFYVTLCAVLMSWVQVEAHASSRRGKWQEVHRALVFLLLIHIAFFGTGNVASMSSFEISSTYRFVTVFSPFLMGTLLIGKILIPFMLVACTFHLILLLPTPVEAKADRLPASRYFLLVVAMSDLLALHFLFLVKNEGSWKEIGNSISMFGIVNAQIVFVPVLFLLAQVFNRGVVPRMTDTRWYEMKRQ